VSLDANPTAAANALPPAASSSFRARFVKVFRSNPTTAAGIVVIAVLLLVAAFAPVLAPYDPYATDPRFALKPPSAEHWFGTGTFGEDIFSRVVYGARLALLIAFGAVGIALVIGSLLGAIAGFYGGFVGSAIMRVVEVMQAFPSFILALAIAGALGPSFTNLIIAVAITNIPIYAHLMRVGVLNHRQSEYALASIALGASSWRTLFRHLIPNSLGPIFVQATLQPGYAILTAAGLSFLGLGVRVPEPEWGLMVAMGSSRIISGQWWLSLFPGVAIMIAVMGFNLLGDGLRDLFDPHAS